MTDGSAKRSSPPQHLVSRKAAKLVGGVLGLIVIGFLFSLGRSTVHGWKIVADSLPDRISMPQRQLPAGSRVIFDNSEVAQLTLQSTLPRQRDLGGELLVIEGNWNAEGHVGGVISDSTLIGIINTDAQTGIVEIELEPPSAPRGPPVGLLRLHPFRHGYRLYPY
jgi:hypothetical protein